MSSLQKQLELGREKLSLGDYSGALAHADAALALDSASFEALQLRSRALYLLGRDAEALQTLRQAHAVLHNVLAASASHLPMSDYELPGDEEFAPHSAIGIDALETLLALRERHTLDTDLLSLLAELAEDAGRFEIARDAFTDLVTANPECLEAWEGLVHVLCHEDLDAALEALARALSRFPTHALFHEFHGFIRYRRQQYRFAIDAYQQAIHFGAEQPENYHALVESYLALDDVPTALDILQTLAQRNANDVETHRFGVEITLQCERYDLAMQHAHQLVRLQPTHAETYCYKAWVELADHDYHAAERTLRLGFCKAMDGAYALFELVELLIADGKLEAALSIANLAIELAPEHAESHAARGKVLRELGLFDDALESFRQAAALAPQDDAYQTWLGVVYDNIGDYPAALEQFNHVLSRHPTDVWTLSNRGLTYLAMDQAEQAQHDFHRGIEIDPQDAPLYFWRACALVKQGEHDLAFRDLYRAVDLNDTIYHWLEQEVSLLPLQHDPRFRELLHRIHYEG